MTNPENGTTTFAYNADGSMASKADAKSQVISYYYDTLGRLTQIKNGATILRALTYDANGGYGSYLSGRLARVDYGEGNCNPCGALGNAWSEFYSYDPAGEMQKKILVWSRIGYLTASLEAHWTYDTEGKVASIKYLNYYGETGPTHTYTFGSMPRPLFRTIGGVSSVVQSGSIWGLTPGNTNFAGGSTSGTGGLLFGTISVGTSTGGLQGNPFSPSSNGTVTISAGASVSFITLPLSIVATTSTYSQPLPIGSLQEGGGNPNDYAIYWAKKANCR